MKSMKALFPWLLATLLLWGPAATAFARNSETGELESWRASGSRTAITAFVARVTDTSSDDYVAPADRIAVFDNDGTLWTEQPLYSQLLFALDTARARIEAKPELAEQSPWREVATGDREKLANLGREGLLDLMFQTHAGMSEAAFRDAVRSWLAEARHPALGRPYTETVYQPMLELLDYLRANDFAVYIVSGGGVAFLRAWAEDVYGIPPQQVIGSRMALEYRSEGGKGSLFRRAEIAHINDGPGKPVGIQQVIGKRPILAVGNSDGDFEMLEWTTSGPGVRLGVLIHHTDDERELAYDRNSAIGHLERGLDEAKSRGWVLVDMASDWTLVFGEK
jgi:phosphoserine phosphatase